jgi:hypothetical protein
MCFVVPLGSLDEERHVARCSDAPDRQLSMSRYRRRGRDRGDRIRDTALI